MLLSFSLALWVASVCARPAENRALSRRLHYANLSSPVPGQVLYPGRPFRIRYVNEATDATATQVLLFNNTGLFRIASDLPFSNHRTDTHVVLPPWVSHGTYDFVFRDNNMMRDEEFQDVVLMTIYVGKRPPSGIGSIASNNNEGILLLQKQQEEMDAQIVDEDCGKVLEKRAPHPPRFIEPSNGSTYLIGSQIHILYRDGETDANRVNFVLHSISTGSEYLLGTVPFESYTANLTHRFSGRAPEGDYKLIARENSDQKNAIFTDAFSIEIKISKPKKTYSSYQPKKYNDDDGYGKYLAESYYPGYHIRNSKRSKSIEMTEGPSIILPEVAEDVSLGSKIECKIHDPMATTETVKFILRSKHVKERFLEQTTFERLLGQVDFEGHFAGGHFDIPLDIPAGTYRIIAEQNSVSKPHYFSDVVSTTIFVTSQQGWGIRDGKEVDSFKIDENVGLSKPSDSGISDLNTSDQNLDKISEVLYHQLNRRENHLPRFISPVHQQVIQAGHTFKCAMLDGQVSNEKAKFVLRRQQPSDEYTLAEVEFDSSLADETCVVPAHLTPGVYELVAKENTLSQPENYNDVVLVNIIVTSPTGNSEKTRRSLSQRAPHPVTLLSPVVFQNITPGDMVSCHLKDGETTASMVKFLLRSENGHETVLGQTSFSNFQARSAFRCPNHLTKGTYLFVVQENSSYDPDDYRDSVHVQVNVLDINNNNNGYPTPSNMSSNSTSVPPNSTAVPTNSTEVPTNSTSLPPNSTPPIVPVDAPVPGSILPTPPLTPQPPVAVNPAPMITPASGDSGTAQAGTPSAPTSVFTPTSGAVLRYEWASVLAVLPLAFMLLL